MTAHLAGRLRRRALRDARLGAARVRSRRATFGRGCEISGGLHISVEGDGHMRVGDECVLDTGMVLVSWGDLTIGDRSIFGHHCTIAARESVVIGADCLIAEQVSIRDHDHRFDRLDVPVRSQGTVSSPVVIGNDVWLGSKVVVTKGVTIGDHAVIGAGAVVTGNIPPGAIALGVPARVVGYRGARESTAE